MLELMGLSAFLEGVSGISPGLWHWSCSWPEQTFVPPTPRRDASLQPSWARGHQAQPEPPPSSPLGAASRHSHLPQTTRGSPSLPHLTRLHCCFLFETQNREVHCGGKLIFSLFTLEASLDPNVPIATLILPSCTYCIISYIYSRPTGIQIPHMCKRMS